MNDSLQLIWPGIAPVGDFDQRAWIDGKAASVDDAIGRVAAMLAESEHPVVTGLNLLTMEAAGAAIDLARAVEARLVPVGYAHRDMPVMQQGTMDEAYRCDFIIKPGPEQWATDHPIAADIAGHVLHSLFVPSGLDDVLRLRAQVQKLGERAITDITMKPVKRLAVLLPPGTRGEAVSQWHQIAAELQYSIRTCVLELPDVAVAGNIRGAMEVLTWRTGCYGAIDFGGGSVRPYRGPADTDLAVEVGATLSQVHADKRIVIGPAASPDAAVAITTPGLAFGLAGKVMRFDGLTLDLCEQGTTPQPDPAVTVLSALAGYLQRSHVSR